MTIEELFHRGLSLDKLRAFMEVARFESVTVAAKGNPSRRSLMSRQISELERTLGFELFHRRGKALHLTEAGRELALLTAAYFSEFENLTEKFLNRQESLRIGAGASVFEILLFPRIHQIEQSFPRVHFEFIGTSTEQAIQKLRRSEIDLAILRADHGEQGLVEFPACAIPFCIVGRRDLDRHIGDWTIVEFLRRIPLTIIGGGGKWVEALKKIYINLEIELQVSHQVETFGHVRDLLKSGVPAGILPESMAEEFDPEHFLIIRDPLLNTLTRFLSVVGDARAMRVRDKLERYARKLVDLMKSSNAKTESGVANLVRKRW